MIQTSQLKNEEGKRFGLLTVIGRAPDKIYSNGARSASWICRCDCGNTTIVTGRALRSGNTKSCGCKRTVTLRKKLRVQNSFKFYGDIAIGYTQKDEPFIIDASDYEKVKEYCWRKNIDGYIVTTVGRKNLFLHRFIMEVSDDMVVDHINHDTGDNRKLNLRCVSQSKNMQNARNNRRNIDGVKGVTFDRKWKKWIARITVNKETIRLGYYDTFEEAVASRKTAEEKYFGENSYERSMAISPLIEVA